MRCKLQIFSRLSFSLEKFDQKKKNSIGKRKETEKEIAKNKKRFLQVTRPEASIRPGFSVSARPLFKQRVLPSRADRHHQVSDEFSEHGGDEEEEEAEDLRRSFHDRRARLALRFLAPLGMRTELSGGIVDRSRRRIRRSRLRSFSNSPSRLGTYFHRLPLAVV